MEAANVSPSFCRYRRIATSLSARFIVRKIPPGDVSCSHATSLCLESLMRLLRLDSVATFKRRKASKDARYQFHVQDSRIMRRVPVAFLLRLARIAKPSIDDVRYIQNEWYQPSVVKAITKLERSSGTLMLLEPIIHTEGGGRLCKAEYLC